MQLVSRIAAAQATIDRFLDQEFQWGANDCAHLAAFAVRSLGHADPLASVPSYATRRNALKAMRKAGITSFADQLAKLGFEPIPPAFALPGDIVGIPAEEDDEAKGWLALGVAIGQDRVLGFANGRCSWAPTHVCSHAWRVPPVGEAA